MNVYFDSSTLVKGLLREDGWQVADEIWDLARRATASTLTHAEVGAALAAARGSGRLTKRAFERARQLADDRRADLYEVELDRGMASAARFIAERFALRAADAVHLATALAADDPHLVMATWDGDLQRASIAAGLRVAPAKP